MEGNDDMSTPTGSEENQAEHGMRPRQFAKKYGVAESLVYKGCSDGSIPCVRLGNRFVILWREWEKKANVRIR